MGDWHLERSRHGGADRIPLPIDRGGLWLCGKHFVGPDVEAALDATGATTVVCLNQPDEIADRYPEYVDWLRANRHGRALWYPIHDLHAPDTERARELLDDVVERITDGEVLLVHCGAGIGRAGTLAAAVLMRLGVPMADAVDTVAAHRPMAGPEAGAQRDLLENLGAD